MKPLFLFYLPLCIFFSCTQHPSSYHTSSDSLITILHYQISVLKSVPTHSKNIPPLPDSLSSADSMLYQDITHNYLNATSIIDSIQSIIPKLIAEYDTLSKYKNVNDSALLNRLKYLSTVNQHYISEYYKALALAEYNHLFLQHFSTSAKR